MERLSPWLAEARALLVLGVPLIFTQLAQMAIITTDILMLGQLGAPELAAATIGVTLYYFGWLVGFGPSAAVSPVIAHILGADPGERAEVRKTLIAGLWSAAIVTIPILGVLLFAEHFLLAIGLAPDLATRSAQYTHSIMLGLPFAIAVMTLRSFATALSSPRAPLIATLLMIGVNAILNYALIFGHFGFPALGLVGSGYASSIANAFGFFLLLAWIVWRAPFRQYEALKGDWRPDWTKLRELIALGFPMGMSAMFEGGLFNAGVLLMGYFGTVALAAHQIAVNFASITFMTALGLSLGGTVRVGRFAGAGDAEGVRRAGYTVMGLSCGMMLVCALFMALFPRTIAGFYLGTDDPDRGAVIGQAVSFLLIAALFQIFDALQVSASMALRGLKDARMPMLLTGVSYWAIAFPACYLLAFPAGWGGMGIWVGYTLGLAAAALTLSVRFWQLARAFKPL
jgi:MATE family multidrug resistance protein